MTTYYVHKGVGSDSNNGLSWANCWASLAKAAAVSGPNDTIYVRAGTTPYYERLSLAKNGQRWLADAGHLPIVDGKYHDHLADFNLSNKPPNTYVVQKTGKLSFPSLAGISANDCVLDGFKICNSAGRGLAVSGARNTVQNCWIDWTYTSGIMVNTDDTRAGCDGNVIQDTEVTRCSAAVYAALDQKPEVWGRPWDVIVAAKNCQNTTFRRMMVHHNHAEGIVLGAGTTGCVIEYCGSWNNEHMCIYLNNAANATIRYNFAFSTKHPEVLRGKSAVASEPLVITQEANNAAGGEVLNAKVYGNILVGGRWTFTLARTGTNQSTRLQHCYIGFNTIVGLPGITQAVLDGASAHGHYESVFENNVIYVPAGVELKNRFTDPMTGLKARGNVIYRPGGNVPLPGWLNGPGTIVADPKLVAAAATITDNGGILDNPPHGGNNFSVNNYRLTGSSPAINNAVVSYPFNGHEGVEAARTTDYFGARRSAPDSGAHEYGGVVTSSVVASFYAQPAAQTVNPGQLVSFTNTSFTTGTAEITGQTWTVKKGAATVATATTADYAYMFASTGSYTVTLVVTASGGLSDSEAIAYTVEDAGPGVVVSAAISASPSQTTLAQGTAVAFTDASTVQNGSIGSRLWEVLNLPGLSLVGSFTTQNLNFAFTTAGNFRVRLTVTAATGETGQAARDYTITAGSGQTVTAAFTSSDTDNAVDAGDSITFTNTSSVSGTTISGYLWSVGAFTSTDTNLEYAFTQAGVYTVSLRVDTAAGISDTTAVTVIVRGEVSAGADVMIVPVSYSLNTTAGTQTVTAAALGGKIPKGAFIRVVGGTAAGTVANGATWSEGAASATAQWVHSRMSSNGSTPAAAWRRYSTAATIMTLSASGDVTGLASVGRFVAGGLELDITIPFPAGYLAEVVFFAGDACDFWAGSFSIGAQNATVTVDTGIDADAVYLCSTWAAQENTSEANADISRGWATAAAQYHFRNRDKDGANPTELVSRIQTRIGSSADGTGGYTSIEMLSLSAGGFALTPRSSALNRTASAFAFRAGGRGVYLGLVALPTSGALTVPLAFPAQTVMALTSSFFTQDGGQLGGNDAQGQGWYDLSIHGPAAWSGSVASANGTTPSATRQLGVAGFRAVSPSGALYYNGTGALAADAFSVTWTAQPAAPYRILVLAVEAGEILGTPGDGPLADFQFSLEPAAADGVRTTAWLDSSVANGRGSPILTYAWDFGDGQTSSEASPFHVYEEAGTYELSLTVTTALGSDTKTVTIEVADTQPLFAPILVGPSEALTSGSDTENAIDEVTLDHTHKILFERVLHLREMTDDEYADFVAEEADPVYALVGLYGQKVVIRFADGTLRTIDTVAV